MGIVPTPRSDVETDKNKRRGAMDEDELSKIEDW
jgi:hypothetical protein